MVLAPLMALPPMALAAAGPSVATPARALTVQGPLKDAVTSRCSW